MERSRLVGYENRYQVFIRSSRDSGGVPGPVVTETPWRTTIAFLSKVIGIEIELDFRAMGIFVLVVRLENGKLPTGYDMSDGKKVRIHLENFINVERHRKRNGLRTLDEFISELCFYTEVMKHGMSSIIDKGEGDIWERVR